MSEDRYREIRELPFDRVARALDIDFSKFKSRKGGSEHAGPCPVHRPRRNNTSFSYSADGKWNCFSCNEKGRGAIDLAMKVREINFQSAVELLEPYAGSKIASEATQKAKAPQITIRQEIHSENEARRFTYEKFKVDSPWLTARGFTEETLDGYGVFQYRNPARRSAYQDKILIRLQRFSDGATVGYLARDPRPAEERGESPKYVQPAGLHKSLELFGAWQLKDQSPIRVLYVVESPFACLHFAQLNLPCVALMGWTVSPQQAEIIGHLAKGVVFCPDSDKREEAKQYISLLAEKVWVKYPVLPVPDPEQLTPDQIRALT